MKEVSNLSQQTTEKILATDSEIVVKYRPLYVMENWLKKRFSERSQKKLFFSVAVLLLFFLLGGPMFVLHVISIVLGTQAKGAAVAAAIVFANLQIMWFFVSIVCCLAVGGSVWYLCQPTHLCFNRSGMRFGYRFLSVRNFCSNLISFAGIKSYFVPSLSWQSLTQIHLRYPANKTSPLESILCFQASNKNQLKIKLAAVPTEEERAKVLKALEIWAPEVNRDAEIMQLLVPSPQNSYTELWLQALSAPPKRKRLQPLREETNLKNGCYTIMGILGIGGQSTAYIAQNNTDLSKVVLKEFIFPIYVDIRVRRESLERFEHEARILKELDHDRIVKLIDYFVEDHRGYLVLEHIAGSTLRDKIIKEGRLSHSFVIALAQQMCYILAYLHSLSPPMVHRDFTPDNLILQKDGTLKLLDFNVARQVEHTHTGTVVGKHAYLPPEQFRGKPCPQSDIYALGATLFYLLVGLDPEPISTSHPASANSNVSNSLDFVVSKATALNLEDRYTNIHELAADLESLRCRQETAQF